MVVKIEVMQIASPKHFHLRNDKGDLKGFQTNFETLFLQVSVTIWHLSIRECVREKKSACTLLKNNETSLARTVTTIFSSKTVDDRTESIIHSHRRLIHVRRFTSSLGKRQGKYRGLWAELGKYWPGKEPVRLQDSLPCPLKKNNAKYWLSL